MSGAEIREVSIGHDETRLDGIGELQFSLSAARSWSFFSVGGRRQVRSVGRVWTTECRVGQFLEIRGVYRQVELAFGEPGDGGARDN